MSIIAIDNDSTDNSVALLEKYPQVQLVKSPEILGFGKANNIGMQMALEQGADYLFLLNQDAWVFDDTIGRLVDVMEMGMQKTGIASPTHYIADGQTLDANFKTYLERSKPLKQEGLFTANFVNAAAWMLSRECVQNHESITFNGLSPAGSKVNKAHHTYFILTSAAQTAIATAAQEWLSKHE